MPVRILIVDDVEDMRYLIRASLQRVEGVAVVAEAATGAEALDRLGEQPVDVVILDLGLPDGRGHELVPRIRAASSARIVVFTGSDADVLELANQVDGFLRKSGDMRPLANLVTRLHGSGPFVATLALQMDGSAPRTARQFVDAHVRAWHCEGSLDEALLATSELVTNAVVHARSYPHLLLALRGDVLRIEVIDDSSVEPTVQDPSDVDEHGRGMLIVDAIATDWGIDVTDRGKRIWLELPCAAA